MTELGCSSFFMVCCPSLEQVCVSPEIFLGLICTVNFHRRIGSARLNQNNWPIEPSVLSLDCGWHQVLQKKVQKPRR